MLELPFTRHVAWGTCFDLYSTFDFQLCHVVWDIQAIKSFFQQRQGCRPGIAFCLHGFRSWEKQMCTVLKYLTELPLCRDNFTNVQLWACRFAGMSQKAKYIAMCSLHGPVFWLFFVRCLRDVGVAICKKRFRNSYKQCWRWGQAQQFEPKLPHLVMFSA